MRGVLQGKTTSASDASITMCSTFTGIQTRVKKAGGQGNGPARCLAQSPLPAPTPRHAAQPLFRPAPRPQPAHLLLRGLLFEDAPGVDHVVLRGLRARHDVGAIQPAPPLCLHQHLAYLRRRARRGAGGAKER